MEAPIELRVARWSDRFFAWLIDFIIVLVVVEGILHAAAYPVWLEGDPERWFRNAEPLGHLIRSLAFFAYWTYLESTKGQSVGKMILRLKTVDLSGKNADVRDVALASFGKAFLLPIDVLLGWIFTNEKRQRVFNRLSNTIVIKLEERENLPRNVSYKKD